MTQGQPDASGKMLPCPNPWCNSEKVITVAFEYNGPKWQTACDNCTVGGPLCDSEAEAIAAWNTRRPTPSADADRVREQLERQRAENAKLQRAILHPHEQINPAPKTYGMKKVAYGDEILAELPEGQYVKLEDYRALARHFLKRGAEIERLEAALAKAPSAQPAPTAAAEGLREAELEAEVAALKESLEGKEAIIYGLLTKGSQ
jgi:hypothetical protein